ncbi:hypothetical protein ACFQ0B_59115 [Nonomuraea thailandensis]
MRIVPSASWIGVPCAAPPCSRSPGVVRTASERSQLSPSSSVDEVSTPRRAVCGPVLAG